MVTAFVFITTRTGKEKDVLHKILRENTVKEATTVYGDYDIVAKIEAETVDKLNEFIIKHLRGLQDVSSTNTLIGL
ncbi:TPA: Lrp/AsnC ligand binding domain-containing protein [archaeon]|uniref:Lrp/AsnC ligand binding domain-containing protein n=1 Tax=Candidatus Naiadarchaeum limnaeum TaxID=2756139 RepID=A0A832V172_9ARCH|nr:Lrp/AsnC ligand binding domain-containing protein [Candidatus Naiadarchaeales archaeon SRR2090153.bin1042]HIK00093.1 Lrp/AsnC ligand binding domain-containing protein [Candidatus Naiadarchaeum limnaeum]